MFSNNNPGSAVSGQNELIQAQDSMDIDQQLKQMHADFDPIYSALMNYQCAAMEVETKFNILNNRLSIDGEHNPIESVKSRVKDLDSIIRKLAKHNFPITVESIEKLHDVAGVRVVCSFVDDIYRLAECFLAQDDVTLVKRFDYIENPQPSGYRSLHLIVKTPVYTEIGKKEMLVEVQMRTIAMDFWASLSHKLQYKKNLNPETAEQLAEELKACAEESAKLDKKMLNIRNRIAEGGAAASDS